jgi:hypothetical protein
METTMNLERLIRQNGDLASRVEAEAWRIHYDSVADLFVLHGDIPEDSEYVPVNGDGLMVRADAAGRIHALAIEDFGSFAARHGDFRLMRFCLRHPLMARLAFYPVLLIASAKEMLTERYQRKEVLEYVSALAVFGATA